MVDEEAVHGGIVGIIVPPPVIQAIINKTAAFVAKHGRAFETKIAGSAQAGSSKFQFLDASNPYNLYYEAKVKELSERDPTEEEKKDCLQQSAGLEEVQGMAPGEKAALTTLPTAAGKGEKQIQNKAILSLLARIEPSDTRSEHFLRHDIFRVDHPGTISVFLSGLIKLTAQYTAIAGESFLSGIVARESGNPQFDFLKPGSVYFHYFTSLVDSYSRSLKPPEDVKNALHDYSRESSATYTGMACLKDCVAKFNESQKQAELARQEAVRAGEEIALAAIDWHDFVVVQTIRFEDEQSDGNAPSQDKVHILANRSAAVAVGQEARGSGSDMDNSSSDDDGMDMSGSEGEDMGDEIESTRLNVRKDYVPSVSGRVLPQQVVVDPKSGRSVNVNKIGEHMRIELLHPKWREEQMKAAEKQKSTNVAAGASISENLKRFAEKRRGIQSGLVSDETREKKNVVVWDGDYRSIDAARAAAAVAAATTVGEETSSTAVVGPERKRPRVDQ
jgi:splicing factor 3A subunit 1